MLNLPYIHLSHICWNEQLVYIQYLFFSHLFPLLPWFAGHLQSVYVQIYKLYRWMDQEIHRNPIPPAGWCHGKNPAGNPSFSHGKKFMACSSRAKATKPAMTPTERAQSLHGGFENFSQIGKTSWLINMYIYIYNYIIYNIIYIYISYHINFCKVIDKFPWS